MNMFKNNGGFTLVELIVVIAILAILAGVAIPTYSGYISKASDAADLTLLDSVKTAAVFAATEKDEGHDISVDEIVVVNNATTVTAIDYGTDNTKGTSDDATLSNLDVSEYVGTIKLNEKVTGATWTAATGWTLTKTN